MSINSVSSLVTDMDQTTPSLIGIQNIVYSLKFNLEGMFIFYYVYMNEAYSITLDWNEQSKIRLFIGMNLICYY